MDVCFLSCLQLKYWDRALGLILVSPLCQTPSWTEWLYNKAMINLLYFCGMTGFVKETLLQRYFSPVSCLQIFYLFPGICCKILLSSNCHKHQNLWRSLGLMFLYCSSWQEVRAACLEGTDVLMTYRRVSLSGLLNTSHATTNLFFRAFCCSILQRKSLQV